MPLPGPRREIWAIVRSPVAKIDQLLWLDSELHPQGVLLDRPPIAIGRSYGRYEMRIGLRAADAIG
jgi:hypothetical protein